MSSRLRGEKGVKVNRQEFGDAKTGVGLSTGTEAKPTLGTTYLLTYRGPKKKMHQPLDRWVPRQSNPPPISRVGTGHRVYFLGQFSITWQCGKLGLDCTWYLERNCVS